MLFQHAAIHKHHTPLFCHYDFDQFVDSILNNSITFWVVHRGEDKTAGVESSWRQLLTAPRAGVVKVIRVEIE